MANRDAAGADSTDAPGFNRAHFHRELNAQMLEFFRKNIPSDKGDPPPRRK
jgi:hypothetical protein